MESKTGSFIFRSILLVALAILFADASSLVSLEDFFTAPPQLSDQNSFTANAPDPSQLHLANGGLRQGFTEDELNNIAVYEQWKDSVVNVTTEVLAYRWFFDPVPEEGATGSGAIIDASGYVLTNRHVIKDAVRVYLTMHDGQRYEGEVVGVDGENDLAVIKFDPEGRILSPIPFGSSGDLQVGQKVLAIGYPYAFDQTLTVGVISGLGRPIKTSTNLIIQDMIQTDAAINPGNSGGPLLDSSGRLIGINTMIYTPSSGSVGLGFAVPVDTAKRVVPELISTGMVERGWIDIAPIQLFPDLVSYARLPVDQGILVSQVSAGGKAQEAGLRGGSRSQGVRYGSTIIYLGGDIITEVDGTPIATIANLYESLEDNKPGERVTVEYIRDGRTFTTEVELIVRPEQVSVE